MEWNEKPVDMRNIIRDAIASVSQIFNENKVALHTDLPDTPAIVKADRDRMMQVVINLLSNAAKFCAPSVGRVEVSLKPDADTFRVAVADNGPGIPPDQALRVFDKFHQVSDEQRGKPKGTGLGLAITRLIVEHHGGRIWVERTSPEGTCFMFSLPRLEAEAQALPTRDTRASAD